MTEQARVSGTERYSEVCLYLSAYLWKVNRYKTHRAHSMVSPHFWGLDWDPLDDKSVHRQSIQNNWQSTNITVIVCLVGPQKSPAFLGTPHPWVQGIVMLGYITIVYYYIKAGWLKTEVHTLPISQLHGKFRAAWRNCQVTYFNFRVFLAQHVLFSLRRSSKN